MAKINYKFFDGQKGLFHKNLAEYRIMEIIQNCENKNYDCYFMNHKDSEYEGFSFLSSNRENILSWYPFKANANILEVGAGLGALTGLLCEKAESVVAVEMTDIRAKCILERHQDKENLEIMVGNFNEMKFERKFDYVILIGVLEYARHFLSAENAHVEFMKKIKELLTPDGVVLLGIENRIGLKYFAGEVEGHTRRLFLGLNDYDEYDHIRTFSKSELSDILGEAGFKTCRYLYPFPDYDFPELIYSEEILDFLDFGQEYPSVYFDRLDLFNEIRMYRTLQKNNAVTLFSNSFFVEISNNSTSPEKIIFAKTPIRKMREEKIVTVISESNGVKRVKKITSQNNLQALNHYQEIYEKMKMINRKATYVPVELKDDYLEMPFIDKERAENILNHQIEHALKRNNGDFAKKIEEIKDIFKYIKEKIVTEVEITADYYTDEFIEYFGGGKTEQALSCIRYANIDISIEDFFIDENQLYIIDYENTVDFLVPVDYVMVKLIDSWYRKKIKGYKNAEKIISDNELYIACGICLENLPIYKQWQANVGKKINPNFSHYIYEKKTYAFGITNDEEIRKYAGVAE